MIHRRSFFLLTLCCIALAVSVVRADDVSTPTFVRAENLSSVPIYARLVTVLHNYPYEFGGYISKAGMQENDVPAKEQWLQPGERSPWIDVAGVKGKWRGESTISPQQNLSGQ